MIDNKTIILDKSDFTESDIKSIQELCILYTRGEETWHTYTLENGKQIEIDCYDERLTLNDPKGYCVSVYRSSDNPLEVYKGESYILMTIPYKKME